MLTMTTKTLPVDCDALKFFLFVTERDGLDECLGGPMISFSLRSAPSSHVGEIDDDVGDDGNER